MKDDAAAIAVMVIRLSSPARYGNRRKTSINKMGLTRWLSFQSSGAGNSRFLPESAESTAGAATRNRIQML
jgi:hypothetical protein